MPTFEFDTGTSADRTAVTGSTFALTFEDGGVNFTISTTANDDSGPFNQQASFVPDVNGGNITISDNSVGGVITFDVAGTEALTNFGGTGTAGNISLQLGSSVSLSTSFTITFVNTDTAGADQTFVIGPGDTNRLLSFAAGSNNYSHIQFTSAPGGYLIQIDSLTAAITCYLEGTGIATPTGRVAVETLRAGDEILTADGGVTTVNWLGVQPIDTISATPAKANPICFVAGSLAPNVPARDLYVSPDHAMDIDGVLYNATALVNGRSIYQMAQMPRDGFTYYHVDTGAHELILAEGAASETYLDAVGRDAFVNGHEQESAPIITEMAAPRIVARRMVPQDVVDALDARADALGLTGDAQKVA